ncbi:MAG: mammalian cell entry protein, partial [Deltaproteobacteria bacterium]|nr:mammalian cell entry protein [Deltaproteobacteria bacterium]
LNRASTALNSANGLVEPNSAQLEEIGQTLQEVRRAARSLRILADYLEQHPDALIRGKRGEAQ